MGTDRKISSLHFEKNFHGEYFAGAIMLAMSWGFCHTGRTDTAPARRDADPDHHA